MKTTRPNTNCHRKYSAVAGVLLALILAVNNAEYGYAECVATPDCEALGYRSTSCVGGGVKCPWDISKMYCNPNMCSLTITKEMCDAECKDVGEQSCLKDGVTYYAQCGASKCAEGQGCKAGVCVNCDNSCSVGNILYSDYSCNSCIMEDKTAIGVIGYVKGTSALAVYLKQSSSELEWASLTDFPTLTNYSSTSTAIKDYSGRENTFNWALFYGHTNTWNGPGYCNTLTTSGTSKRQWYLPALGELYPSVWTNRVAVKKGLKIAGGDKLERGNYISSSEYIDSANWAVYAELGSIKPRSKNGFEYLRCVLAF